MENKGGDAKTEPKFRPEAPVTLPVPIKVPPFSKGDEKPLQVANPHEYRRRSRSIEVLCEKCDRSIPARRGATPFRSGPYEGGLLCPDCYILFLDENPDPNSSEAARGRMAEEARKIRQEHAMLHGELMHEDDEVRAWLTPRGTILVDLKRVMFCGNDEYTIWRFRALVRAMRSVGEKCPGSDFEKIPWETTESRTK